MGVVALSSVRAREGPRHAFPVAVAVLPLVAVLVAILVFGPFYGIEDDATLLGMVAQVGHDGFWQVWWNHVSADFGTWGMVRPFYWALAYVEDLVIVETEDAVLVIPRERAQDVREIIEELKKKGGQLL